MTEIRFHGRFGQPVGKMARAIGQNVSKQGKHVQVFDAFAAYRPGAPMYSVVRVANEFIRERSSNNTQPDVVVVLDNSLFAVADVTKGLKTGGIIMALNLDESYLGRLGDIYQLIDLEPYFAKVPNVEANIMKALDSQVLK